jgi:hypothetical protein
MKRHTDPLAAVRGVMRGLLYAVLFWAILFTVIAVGLAHCEERPSKDGTYLDWQEVYKEKYEPKTWQQKEAENEKAFPKKDRKAWTTTDTALEVVSEMLLYTDWRMTRDFTGNPEKYPGLHEINLFEGPHPSARRVNMYHGVWLVAHPVISWALPKPFREAFQGVTITTELWCIQNGREAGITIRIALW